MYARSVSASLATTKPCSVSGRSRERDTISNNCEVFDPGAAHMSRHLWCGSTLSANGGIMDTATMHENDGMKRCVWIQMISVCDDTDFMFIKLEEVSAKLVYG